MTPPTTPITPTAPTTPGEPAPPVITPELPAPQAAAGSPPLPAPGPAGSAPAPLYRIEVPLYAQAPAVARQLGILQLDTFHDRHGDQSLLDADGANPARYTLPAAWGRVWGGHSVTSESGAANPEFAGSVYGVQVGHDLYADRGASGQRNHYGLFLGFARATGDVDGYALGTLNRAAGHLDVNAYSVGGYWTHIGPGGWYTDAVLMGSSLTIDPRSNDDIGASTHGTAVSASLEAGLPVPLGATFTLEPQAQLI